MKLPMKISFFGFHLLKPDVQRKWLDIRDFILQKKKLKQEMLFGHCLPKAKV